MKLRRLGKFMVHADFMDLGNLLYVRLMTKIALRSCVYQHHLDAYEIVAECSEFKALGTGMLIPDYVAEVYQSHTGHTPIRFAPLLRDT